MAYSVLYGSLSTHRLFLRWLLTRVQRAHSAEEFVKSALLRNRLSAWITRSFDRLTLRCCKVLFLVGFLGRSLRLNLWARCNSFCRSLAAFRGWEKTVRKVSLSLFRCSIGCFVHLSISSLAIQRLFRKNCCQGLWIYVVGNFIATAYQTTPIFLFLHYINSL